MLSYCAIGYLDTDIFYLSREENDSSLFNNGEIIDFYERRIEDFTRALLII